MNRTAAHNNENLTHLNGKRVLTQNTQLNVRQPLGTHTISNVIDRKSKNYHVSDLEPLKKRTEGVKTRSQTAKQEIHESIGHVVNHTQPAFTIFEDLKSLNEEEHESMEIVERSAQDVSAMTWANAKPSSFGDSMAEDSLQCDQEEEEEEEDEREEMEEEDDYEGDASGTEEGAEEDIEMMNVLLKQKAEVSERYANEHFAYTLGEYRCDIYKNTREKELELMPRCDYMRKQTDINTTMRSILVDWMVEVADEYHLKRETLFLAVNYVDRYLSLYNINRSNLQLVGTAALFISSKYEEVYPPNIGEFVSVTDGTYTNRQVLNMEYTILKSLNFKTTVPTANFFCLDLLNQLSMEKVDYAMSFYILESILVIGEEFLQYTPSIMATASVLVSSLTLRKANCMSQITKCTGYVIMDIIPCIYSIFQAFKKSNEVVQNAVKNKFQSSKYHSVSQFAIPCDLSLDDFLAGNF